MYYLKMDIQKVQSFIFRIPELKSMIGANSLLGEFLSKDLYELKKELKNNPISQEKNWKESIFVKRDSLKQNFKKGILECSGGHFEAIFETEEEIREFIEKATIKADEKIKGAKLSYRVKKVDINDTLVNINKNTESIDIEIKRSESFLIDNPYFINSSKDGITPEKIENVNEKNIEEEQGANFYRLKTDDYLKEFYDYLFQKHLGKNIKLENEFDTLKELSLIEGNNMIAIIAIDGNGMGNKFKEKLQKVENKKFIDAAIEISEFWLNARESMRKALFEALKNIPNGKYKDKLPYSILMLGGDDLLIVSVPEIAFDIVKGVSNGLNGSGITISAGVAYVKYNYPFNQGHKLAESLLSSAKIKSKSKREEIKSAVDWHILFDTKNREIEDIRKEEYLNYYTKDNKKIMEVLSKKPYYIDEAEQIFINAGNIYIKIENKENVGNNKYKLLRTILKKGKSATENYIGKFFENDELKKIFNYQEVEQENIYINNSLDMIELIDFFKMKEATNEKN